MIKLNSMTLEVKLKQFFSHFLKHSQSHPYLNRFSNKNARVILIMNKIIVMSVSKMRLTSRDDGEKER